MYEIEIRLADKKGFHTPSEAKRHYGRYSRDGVTVHWWNTPNLVKDSDHDNIVNYILGKASRGQGSVNYVLSNSKITLLVNPDNVAWASQSGNPTTVSIECSPHLNNEGYKKLGWLINELFNPTNGRYRRNPAMYEHKDWWETVCAGTVSKVRAGQEASKWAKGDYNPKPAPQPKPVPVPPKEPLNTFHLWKEGEIQYLFNKDTHLYDLTSAKDWGSIKKVKDYSKGMAPDGKPVTIVGHVHNNALNRDYYITRHSFDTKKATGFHPADLDIYVPPRPVPEPPKDPEKPGDPVEPTDPTPVEPTDPPAPVELEYPNWFVKLIRDFIAWISDKLGIKGD